MGLSMPTSKQWEQLRTLDKIVRKTDKGSFRQRYMLGQINNLRKDMGLPPVAVPSRPTRPDNNTGPNEHLPNGLSADPDLASDVGAAKTLFDIEGDNP